jgi:hypothetical protein
MARQPLHRQTERAVDLAGWIMPLLRYFSFVGGALLALIFVVSSYFPEPETTNSRDVARPIIRILSDRVGPPRVNIDTRVRAAVVPALLPDIPQQSTAREAAAQLSAPLPTPAAPTKIVVKKMRIVKRSDLQRMAANPQGFQPFRLAW